MCTHLITSQDRGNLSGDSRSPLAINALELRRIPGSDHANQWHKMDTHA
jgi:hypothetical protein